MQEEAEPHSGHVAFNVWSWKLRPGDSAIRQALGVAKAAGRDDMGRTMIAVQAVQQARPDMTAADALAAVNLVQRS